MILTDKLIKQLPLELRTPRGNEQPVVSNPKAHCFWIGHILGDGYISSSKGYMQIDQASEKLARWFHLILNSLNILPKASQIQEQLRYDKRYETTYKSYRFATRAYKLEPWVNTFYKAGKNNKKEKTIPTNIGDLLIDSFSIAIWFLGDGWFDGDNVGFAAGSLSISECELLQSCLYNNFGLKTSLVLLDPLKNNGRQVHRFTVKSESYSAFYNLVNPYIEQLVKEVGTIDKDQFLKRKVLPKPSKT